MAENINLDDPNQTAFTIPFTGDDGDGEDVEVPFPRPLHSEYDLPEGEQLRIDAYTAAWRKCLDRIKSIVTALHAPIVSKIEHEVHTSYDRALPGLPYPEIPVIGITDPTSSSTFLDRIATLTDSFDPNDKVASNTTAFTSHLYPHDCNNVMSAMKALIAGFINRSNILEKGSGRSGISLANYDIETLLAWYTAIRNTYGLAEQCPKLVVLLHDFEQLDPLVIQDVFSISSLYIPRLPLVFILALSSPASPSYLHSTYPRSTTALLRFSSYTVPTGAKVLEEILLGTFFDPEFEPEIIIGPGVLAYLADYYNRHDSSMDSVLNILQLAHLRHFSGEALTLVVKSTPSPEILSQDTSLQFVEELWSRQQSSKTPANSNERDWSQQSIPSLIAATDNARSTVYARAHRIRIGFRVVKLIQDFMTRQGYKGLDWDNPLKGIGIVDVMISALQGGLKSDVKYLGTMIKKLKVPQLAELFDDMHTFFDRLPLDVPNSEGEARANLVVAINALPPPGDDDVTGASSQVAASFADWLVKYLNDLLTPLGNVPLWNIWYTGESSFPSSLINPSVRATVVAGLLHPHDFTEQSRRKDGEQTDPALWELPDTSILFHRYLDSGKMLNIYDWFAVFQQELETQRTNLKERALAAKSRQSSPRKRNGKGKAKESEKPESEEDLERWQLEVQARFIRALQDLDYLGFLKHTGRKADHVQRVVFDMHD